MASALLARAMMRLSGFGTLLKVFQMSDCMHIQKSVKIGEPSKSESCMAM
eukprot:m.191737 g.191737  ORF g.191737 m.191737 type:complete len:50 (+) comp15648_c0_seq8:547-696(+)